MTIVRVKVPRRFQTWRRRLRLVLYGYLAIKVAGLAYYAWRWLA